MQTRLINGIGISKEQESFYRCISLVCDPEELDMSNQDAYYDEYLPALSQFENTVTDIADTYWFRACGDVSSQWPPNSVNEAIKRGIRAGYAWAKLELKNG